MKENFGEHLKIVSILEEGELTEKIIANLESIIEKSEMIGEGGNAIVYAMEEGELSGICLKRIKEVPQLKGNDIFKEHDFQHRAREAGVETPLPILVISDEKSKILVMQRVRGASIEEILTKKKPLTENFDFEKFISKLTNSVKLLQEKAGIVHRDLKVSNVMINEKGDPVIIDFGVSGEKIGSGGEYDELSYEENVLMFNHSTQHYQSVSGYFENDYKKIKDIKASIKSFLNQDLTNNRNMIV